MAQFINTNLASLNSQRNLNSSQGALMTSLQRLSSGLRINSAKDDAAGMAISSRMTAQISGLNQAARNANDGISLAQTAEGALGTITDNLQRMRELSVQAANGSNSASDRSAIQAEITQLQQEINRVATTSQFNGMNLLDGTLSNTQFQVGANANQTISAAIGNAQANAIGANQLTSTNTTAGFAMGAFKASGAVTTFSTNNVVSQTLTITGAGTSGAVTVAVTASAGGAAATNTTGSAHDIAAGVNAVSATTGVTATATTSVTLQGFAAGNVSLKLQGAPTAAGTLGSTNIVSVSATLASANDLSGLTAAINAQQGTTGISAVADTINGKITLTQADGYDIGVMNTNAAATTITVKDMVGGTSAVLAAAGAAASSVVVGGRLSFTSNTSYTIQSSLTAAAGSLFSNVTANLVNASSLSAVSAIDVTTLTGSIPSGANNAISVIDAALSTINSSRAALGAMQNRFSSAVSNLQTTSENLSAARSRIQDTDFAAETGALTRAQILQQAGTAMLAQANSVPNGVMTLLR